MDGHPHADTFPERVNRLQRVTSDLHVTRARFQGIYDSWIEQRNQPELPPGFLFSIASGLDRAHGKLPLPLNPANDTDAVAIALAMLPKDEDTLAFFSVALASGVFDKPGSELEERTAGRNKAMGLLIETLDRDALEQILPEAKPQKFTTAEAQAHDETALWIDPGHLLPAIVLARRRLCRIVLKERNGRQKTLGTGFLIGPSSVLTNTHVVENITKDKLRDDELLCWFDYSDTTGRKKDSSAFHFAAPDWKIGDSPVGLKQPAVAPNEWWKDDQILETWLADVDQSLDYTVIRLATAPGLQRGWYDLQNLKATSTQHAIALHHPTGADQSVTLGTMSVSSPTDVRLFHQAATATGSSGGLLLNEFGEPIGLHHVGISYVEEVVSPVDPSKKTDTRRFINVAINLRNIAADLAANELFEEICKTSPIATVLGCIDGAHPVFGREELLNDLRTMWDKPNKRILMVHVEKSDIPVRSPGKSFTIDIIQSLFRRPEHHHIVFRAGQTHADALDFARDTVRSFAQDLVDTIPSEPETTTTAYVQTLVTFVVTKLRERLSNGTVWLMIDDLDWHSLSDASGREFLATLYDKISRTPNMRVVLIGLPENIEISGIDEDNLVRSKISNSDTSDFQALFKLWFKQRSAMGTAIGDDAVDLLSRTVGSYAQQDEPLRTMARFVVDHMAPFADEFFGEVVLPTGPEDEV